MIYLITKIFLYLLLALGLGVAAGWLWRNLQASAREAALERRMLDSRSRVPQMESTVRTWQQRLERALGELNFREMELAEQQELMAQRDRTVAELERTCAELRQQLASRAATEQPTEAAGGGDELTLHAGDPPPRGQDNAVTEEAGGLEERRTALEEDLARARDELERVQRALAAEQRRVEELTQERELQRRSLQALEQQLELARESHARIANG